MKYYPPALVEMIDNLSRLPGIGRKTAVRLALYMLRRPEDEIRRLGGSIARLQEDVKFCSLCGNFTQQDPCPLCADQSRDAGLVCVVEGPADLMALETTASFTGRYHVLGGVLSPLSGIGPDELRIDDLLERVEAEGIGEVVLALGAGKEGEATANYLIDLLKEKGVKVTRIAVGIPLGSDLEYVDEATLRRAMQARREA